MRTFDICDACWMFLLDRAKAAGNPGKIADLLPKFCSEVSDERLSARLQYCTEASKRLPHGRTESRLHSLSQLHVAPNTHKRKSQRMTSSSIIEEETGLIRRTQIFRMNFNL